MKLLPSLILLASLAVVFAVESRRTLVVLDDLAHRSKFSQYFNSLEKRGYELEFVRADQQDAYLFSFGEINYDALIWFAPKTKSVGPGLTSSMVLDFIDEGGNVILATNSRSSNHVRSVARAVGVVIDERNNYVIDHYSFDDRLDEGDHTTVVTEQPNALPTILGDAAFNPLLYRGVGLSLVQDNTLVFPVLHGSATCYSHNPSKALEEVSVAGKNTVLVASLQARNNARVSVSGSLAIFTDSFFDSAVNSATYSAKKSGNAAFLTELTRWTFLERGLLRMREVNHHRVGETETPEMYTVLDEIEFEMVVEQYNGESWEPYVAEDIQLEFIMLDPYIRKNIEYVGEGRYYVKFIATDVYGIFTFSVDYHRKGFTSLDYKYNIVIRPFRHDQYERYIPAAFPYYASAFSMIGSVVLFSAIYLFHSE